jgi:hypothetical protein
VLILVTVETEQLPVAPVGWIVVVVVVPVMDREFAKLFAAEFAAASPTNPRIHLEGLLSIGFFPLSLVSQRLGDNPVLPAGI